MNRKIFCLVSVFVLSAILVLGSTIAYAQQTPGQIVKFGPGSPPPLEDSNITEDLSGNIGIGTINPTSKVEIAAQDGLAITGFQPFLTLRDANAGNARGIIASGFGDISFYPESFIGATAAVTIKNNAGNVGIGTATPIAKLHALDGASGVGLGSGNAIVGECNTGGCAGVVGSVLNGQAGVLGVADGGAGIAIQGIASNGALAGSFQGGNVAIGTGVDSNGGGFKHRRFRVNGVTQGGHVVTLNWPSPFPDANYTVNAVVEDLNPSQGTQLFMRDVLRKTASGLQVFIVNDSTFTKDADVHVIAIHD